MDYRPEIVLTEQQFNNRTMPKALNGRIFRACSVGLMFACSTLSASAGELHHVHEEVEFLVDEGIQAIIERRIQDSISDEVTERVNDAVAARVRNSVEGEIEDQQIGDVDAGYQPAEDEVDAPIVLDHEVRGRIHNAEPELALDLDVIDQIVERQIESIADQLDLALNVIIDEEGRSALTEEWLVLTDMSSLVALQAEGYIISVLEDLSGLGYVLGVISAPESFDPATTGKAAIQILNSPDVAIDLNHVYMPQRDHAGNPVASVTFQKSNSLNPVWPRMGMIDSTIDQSHPVFEDASISEVVFTPRKFDKATQHGTAIASILIGDSDDFTGFSPGTHLFNGAVFVTDKNGVEFSTVTAIVRAINWLVEHDVPLVNMSLAGPDNIILQRVISSACEKGVTFITAVGNEGPSAAPLYPAAYDCTIAVTATDLEGVPYHRSNRGLHVDFAVPGMNIRHAADKTSYRHSSGTSYAAAVLSGMISSQYAFEDISPTFVRRQLQDRAEDLGVSGRDPIYGFGLVRPVSTAYTLR